MVFSATSVEQFVASGKRVHLDRGAGHLGRRRSRRVLAVQRLPVRTYRALARPGLITAFVLVVALDVLAVLAQRMCLHDPKFGPIRADELWLYLGPLQVQPSSWPRSRWPSGWPTCWSARASARPPGRTCRGRCSRWPGCCSCWSGYNDLGTMICLVVLFVGMLWAAGVRLRVFAAMIGIAAPGVVALDLPARQRYRLARIDAFANPELHQQGDAYQVREGPVRDRQRRLVRGRASARAGSSGAGCPTAQRLHLRGDRRGARRDGLPGRAHPVRGARLHRPAHRPRCTNPFRRLRRRPG
jgi:cell division protein FtsW